MSVLQTGFGNAGGDYTISRSVRLRSSASAYFNRTPASAGNRRTFTYSGWLKRGLLDTSYNKYFFSAKPSASVRDGMYFGTGQTLSVFANDGSSALLVTTQVFRDPSAWYHVVVAVDTTQATSSNRVKIYVNGTQVTSLSTATYPTQNYDWAFNNSVVHTISDDAANVPTGLYHFDGYMTEINVIDGQALTPSSFGETDTITGVWKPKRYTGTYGTNGFYLNFSDNSNNTAATIGKDSSGNGNNWTPNNISVTSGVTYDSMLDTPTPYADGGNGRGNYCVINQLDQLGNTITNGNLKTVVSAGGANVGFGSFAMTSGKWYWEITMTLLQSSGGGIVGVADQSVSIPNRIYYNVSGGWYYAADGLKWNSSTTGASYGASYLTGNVIGIAYDADAGSLTFYKDGASQGVAFNSGLAGKPIVPAFGQNSGGSTQTYDANFGQRPFAYTPPTGFKALNTQNLPDATIKNGSAYMASSLFTGTSGNVTVSNAVNGISFQPDFVWFKARSNAQGHTLVDSDRGVSKYLQSNLTSAEGTFTSPPTFNSDGFTSTTDIHTNGYTYAAWQWKAGGTAVSNTSGSITSSVSAGVSQGFSVVTWTGTGSTATVGHGLGVIPKMVIVKQRGGGGTSGVNDWVVSHASLTSGTYFIRLNTTAAQQSSATVFSAFPSSTVINIGNDSYVNASGGTYVAYCFAEVAGYSKFGSYTGNGSTDGTFVYTGFRPKFVMFKRSDSTGEWGMWDTSRNTYNVSTSRLSANSSGAELNQAATSIDILSNGFKFRTSDSDVNASGGTYIFMALAENPFKNSLAR